MPTPRFGHRNFRQVHLDFHTSEALKGVGERFDAGRFVETLEAGRVDAINLFAKCHHSWCYFPTEVGRVHPHLKPGLDLFGEQVRACEAAGIRTTAYVTVGWSANDALDHPGWCVRKRDGTVYSNRDTDEEPPPIEGAPDEPYPDFFWRFLCPSGDYRRHILDLTREILTRYPTQGLWYDICNLETCWCERCLAGMQERGIDPGDDAAAAAYSVDKWDDFLGACRAVVDELRPADSDKPGSVFFNGLTHMTTPPRILRHQTHYELEDLPTVWGGYDKLPPRARFFARDRKELLAMSGKFHTAWGEFGGYKHPDAIRYECATMLAFNARCNFGDQLHPSGELDAQTYRNIGAGYAHVEAVESLCVDATPETNLGVVFGVRPSDFSVHGTSSSPEDEGACVMLLEAQCDFEGVRELPSELAGKDAVVVTQRCLTRGDAAALSAYADAGGRVVLVGDAALLLGEDEVALDLGLSYEGPADFKIDYTLAGEALRSASGGNLGTGPFLNYDAAPRYAPVGGGGAEVLAAVREPYFDRTYGRYTSHQETPYRLEDAPHAAVARKGNVAVIAHPLGRMYSEHGARVHRELLRAVLAVLGFAPKIRLTGFGSSGRATLYRQPAPGGGAGASRRVLHLTYATPALRGNCEVIEDLPTLHGVEVSVAAAGVTGVRLPLRGQDLEFREEDGRVVFSLPPFSCHEVVVLEGGA